MRSNRAYAISGCAGGSLRLWCLEDGNLLDAKEEGGMLPSSRVTAVEFVGPLMVRGRVLLFTRV